MFCLLADVDIRRRTQLRLGLQDALRAVLRASGGLSADWPIERVLRTGDAAVGTRTLEDLYAQMKDAPVAPDLMALWRQLGVEPDGAGVRLDDHAPLADVRRAIMRAPLATGLRLAARAAPPARSSRSSRAVSASTAQMSAYSSAIERRSCAGAAAAPRASAGVRRSRLSAASPISSANSASFPSSSRPYGCASAATSGSSSAAMPTPASAITGTSRTASAENAPSVRAACARSLERDELAAAATASRTRTPGS